MRTNIILKYLDMLSFAFILATLVIIPLYFDSNLVNPFVLPKQYLFIGLVLANVLVFSIKTVLTRRMEYRQSIIDIPLFVLLLLVLVSSLFSESLYMSFLGRNDIFMLNFTFLLSCLLFFALVVNTIKDVVKWRIMIDVVLMVGAVSSLFFIIKTIFDFSLPIIGSVLNVVDSSNSAFALFLVLIITISGGKLINKSIQSSAALFYFFVFLVSFIPLFVIGFKSVWIVLAIALIMLLLLGFTYIKQSRLGWMSFLFAILIMVSSFVIFGSPKSLQVKMPVEVSLGTAPSYSIASKTVFGSAKGFIIGSGPGTFGTMFSKYRSNDFNYDTVAWSLRFNKPRNTFFALLTESGVIFMVGLVVTLLIVLGHALKRGKREENREIFFEESIRYDDFDLRFEEHIQQRKNSNELALLVVAWIILWIAMGFVSFGVVLWILWWLIAGLIIVGLSLYGKDVITKRSWQFEDMVQYNLAFSFSLIVVMAAAVIVGIIGGRFYSAESAYAKAIKSTSNNDANIYLQKALKLRKNYDTYHIALAKNYLEQASTEARKKKNNGQKIATLVSSAVQEARSATELSPNSVTTWENLALMYENTALLIPQASDWAVKSLQKASELEPTNAYIHWRLGRAHLIAKDSAKSIKSFEKAIELKSDYIGAHLGLASVYEKQTELNKAIKIYEALSDNGNRNTEVLYNYGRLLYNRSKGEDRKNAEKVWLYVIEQNPEYSNALYSLGLLYESMGNKTEALKFFYKVNELNPNNVDIKKKINSLVGVSSFRSSNSN